MSGPGRLVVVGSGDRAMREPILRRAAAVADLWLLDSRPPTWQAPYLAGWSVLPLDDARAVTATLRALPAVDGVLTLLEEHVELVAEVAGDLGLPGTGLAAARACRDKATTRQRLAAAGVPQPAVGLARTRAEAEEVAGRIGYPVVLKPRNLGGSLGVRRADGPADLADAFAAASGARAEGVPLIDGGILIEEYLRGPEISVDSAVLGDRVVPMVIARKSTGPEPWFEEVGHLFDAAEPLFDDPALTDALTAVHRALGVAGGVTHSEWRLTAAGPRLVEVNARLGGQLIPYAGDCQGLDAVRVAVELALGRVPDLRRSPGGAARVHFLYPEHDLRIENLELAGPVPGGIEFFEFTAAPGDELRLPPAAFQSRYGHALVRGRDVPECGARLDALLDLVRLTGGPLTTDDGSHRSGGATDPDPTT